MLVPTPVTTVEGYEEAVGASPGAQEVGVFAASLGGRQQEALVAALREAFAAEAELAGDAQP